MRRQRLTAVIAEAGDDIDNARRKSRLVDEPGKMEQRCWTILGGFQHHRVARRQCRTELHGGQEHLRVPRHDGGDDAQGLAPCRHIEIGLVDRQRRALDLVGKSCVVTVEFSHVTGDGPGFADHLAGIARLQLSDDPGIARHQFGKPGQQLSPRRSGQRRPRTFVKSPVRCFHRAIGIGGGCPRHPRPDGFGRRIEAVEHGSPLGLAKCAVDIEAEAVSHPPVPVPPAP